MKLIIMFSLIILSFNSNAKDFNNGCGSGWNEKFVPDKIKLLGINFIQSCSKHDNCYSKCLEGGDNFGKPICDQTAIDAKEGRRKICDDNFQFSMQRSCKNTSPMQKPICFGIAALYTIAVKKGGGGSFNGMEIPQEYFDFITSEKAKNFDFSNFVKEVNQIQSIDNVSESNKLKFTIEGSRPTVKFISISPNTLPATIKTGKVYKTDFLKYGGVDLSKAKIGEAPLTIKNIDFNKLDLHKLRVEQRFQQTYPSK